MVDVPGVRPRGHLRAPVQHGGRPGLLLLPLPRGALPAARAHPLAHLPLLHVPGPPAAPLQHLLAQPQAPGAGVPLQAVRASIQRGLHPGHAQPIRAAPAGEGAV